MVYISPKRRIRSASLQLACEYYRYIRLVLFFYDGTYFKRFTSIAHNFSPHHITPQPPLPSHNHNLLFTATFPPPLFAVDDIFPTFDFSTILSNTGLKYFINCLGFSVIGKCPMPSIF